MNKKISIKTINKDVVVTIKDFEGELQAKKPLKDLIKEKETRKNRGKKNNYKTNSVQIINDLKEMIINKEGVIFDKEELIDTYNFQKDINLHLLKKDLEKAETVKEVTIKDDKINIKIHGDFNRPIKKELEVSKNLLELSILNRSELKRIMILDTIKDAVNVIAIRYNQADFRATWRAIYDKLEELNGLDIQNAMKINTGYTNKLDFLINNYKKELLISTISIFNETK